MDMLATISRKLINILKVQQLTDLMLKKQIIIEIKLLTMMNLFRNILTYLILANKVKTITSAK